MTTKRRTLLLIVIFIATLCLCILGADLIEKDKLDRYVATFTIAATIVAIIAGLWQLMKPKTDKK
jgi:hypothetical protein